MYRGQASCIGRTRFLFRRLYDVVCTVKVGVLWPVRTQRCLNMQLNLSGMACLHHACRCNSKCRRRIMSGMVSGLCMDRADEGWSLVRQTASPTPNPRVGSSMVAPFPTEPPGNLAA